MLNHIHLLIVYNPQMRLSDLMKEIYERYNILTVTFPKKLCSKEYAHKYLTENQKKLKM